MKGNKGITLIALIVTIIVLIILAGVAIAMLTDDNGILKSASQARYDNIIGSVSEQVSLATLSVKTSITRNMVTIDNYIASSNETKYGGANFDALVKEVADSVGAQPAANYAQAEGYYVGGVLHDYDSNSSDAVHDYGGTDNRDGYGYITIIYTSNSLRSSLPSNIMTTATATTFKSGNTEFIIPADSDFLTAAERAASTTKPANKSTNMAAIAYVIKVTNYSCELSKPRLVTTASLNYLNDTNNELAPELAGVATNF